ncbi:hypothetical protein [Luteolibacter soli]|uniref:Uncharacterized protein n=1 Tax=Luteolibacter soli TaxID=3135280 RepID=A0ABU9AV11_9BACT
MSADPPPIRPRRPVFVTVIGWLFIVAGTLLLPISAISLVMIVAGSYGTASTDLTGFLSVIVAPPVAVATGIGLLCRWSWARPVAVLLLAFLIALNVRDLLNHRSTTETTVDPSGLRTTVLASPPNYHSVPLIGIGVVLIARLLVGFPRGAASAARKLSTPAPERDWRVGHRGRDGMYYEELQGGTWQRIDIDGEMLMGRAHHVIYFASPEAWQRYPEWARHRREEIIARIKGEFRPPDYEYGDGGSTPAAVPVSVPPKTTQQQWGALALFVAILLALAAGMGWLVKSGLERETTWFPAKRASMQRTVTKQAEPTTYWISISLYAAIGLSSGGLALWMLKEGLRSGRR